MKVFSNYRRALHHYPWGYMVLIVLAWGLPAAYGLLNRYFIGYMSYESVVVDQSYEAVEVLLEVILEMFPLAVLALVAWDYTNPRSVRRVVTTVLMMQLGVTVGFAVLLIVGVNEFIDWIRTPPAARPLAARYFTIGALAVPFEAMGMILLVAIKAMRRGGLALMLAAVGVAVNFALDAVFISNFSFSWKLGLIGAAWDRLVSAVFLFLAAGGVFFWLTRTGHYSPASRRQVAAAVVRIGKWNGLESLVRNVGYVIGVVAVVNVIGAHDPAAIGGYNTAMWVM